LGGVRHQPLGIDRGDTSAGKALRTETTINNTRDLPDRKRLTNLLATQLRALQHKLSLPPATTLPRAETHRRQTAGRAAVPAHQPMGTPTRPIRPLSPHSTSRLAREDDTGPDHHETLRVDQFVAVLAPDQTMPEPEPVSRPAWDWDAAVDRKNAAIAELAPLPAMLGDIDVRINDLLAQAGDIERQAGST